jgi:hypothetical protein
MISRLKHCQHSNRRHYLLFISLLPSFYNGRQTYRHFVYPCVCHLTPSPSKFWNNWRIKKNLRVTRTTPNFVLLSLMLLIPTWRTAVKTSKWEPKFLKFWIILLLSLAPQPSLGLGLLHKIRLNFLEASQQFYVLQGRVVSSKPDHHPGRPGRCIYIPQRQGGYPF